MPVDAQADGLYVLSDLHLAPPGEQCVFAAHAPLVALLDRIATSPSPSPQWLVLNGDVFDFLQIPGYEELSLPLAPQRMASLLDALAAEPRERNLVLALQRLTAAGHTLCCLPGNHDAELNLFSVQQVLAQRLGSSQVLPVAAGVWRLEVAGRRVVGVHGHHDDAFNAIGGDTLLRAQSDGDATVKMPPGSRLVCEVINPYRRAKTPDGTPRFPFVDLLPSDRAVVLALLLLDPALAYKRLRAVLGISTDALVRMILMRTGIGGSMLRGAAAAPLAGQAAPPARSEAPEAAWLAALAGTIADAMTPADLAAEAMLARQMEAYFSGQTPVGTRSSKLLTAGEGGVRRLLWRALGSALEAARDAFRPQVPDELARQVMAGWGREVVAITGHTHAAKAIATAAGGTYINTGTWLDLVPMPASTEVAEVQAWLQALQRNEVQRWQGCPVARVDGDGARLLQWTGTALRPWAEGLPSA